MRSLTGTAMWMVSAAALLAGCGQAATPKELADARQAYAEAEQGPASELAPAELDEARQTLQRAEETYEAEGEESPVFKTHAYIAVRRSEIAHAAGEEQKAERRYERYKQQYDELEKKRLNMTQSQLAEVRRQLEDEQRNFAHQKEKLSETITRKDEALTEKEQELTEKQKELAAEREARKEAEGQLAAAIASLNEVGNVKEEARGVVITLSGSVLFATGQHELLPIAKQKLTDVAKALQDQGFEKIVVEGHTDSRGSDENNQQLSLKRAESVRQHLISQGIDANKAEAKGMGESTPVASNDTPEGRANNRRVEIIVRGEGDKGSQADKGSPSGT